MHMTITLARHVSLSMPEKSTNNTKTGMGTVKRPFSKPPATPKARQHLQFWKLSNGSVSGSAALPDLQGDAGAESLQLACPNVFTDSPWSLGSSGVATVPVTADSAGSPRGAEACLAFLHVAKASVTRTTKSKMPKQGFSQPAWLLPIRTFVPSKSKMVQGSPTTSKKEKLICLRRLQAVIKEPKSNATFNTAASFIPKSQPRESANIKPMVRVM
mmetsp:Transcript_6359/g.10336  ORF Transcript_6359/g.10336 Transcript_6359/m.10336 type:complete len:215 (-) Transcript_6359:117-761(-)